MSRRLYAAVRVSDNDQGPGGSVVLAFRGFDWPQVRDSFAAVCRGQSIDRSVIPLTNEIGENWCGRTVNFGYAGGGPAALDDAIAEDFFARTMSGGARSVDTSHRLSAAFRKALTFEVDGVARPETTCAVGTHHVRFSDYGGCLLGYVSGVGADGERFTRDRYFLVLGERLQRSAMAHLAEKSDEVIHDLAFGHALSITRTGPIDEAELATALREVTGCALEQARHVAAAAVATRDDHLIERAQSSDMPLPRASNERDRGPRQGRQ